MFYCVWLLNMCIMLASEGLREAWRYSPRYSGAFNGQRQEWKTPKRTLCQCTASVRVAGVHCWEISLGLADPWNVISVLSVLSISYVFTYSYYMFVCVSCFGLFPFSAWTLLVGRQEGHPACRNWMLVCWWWWFDWICARLIAPVVTTTSIILKTPACPARFIWKMAVKTERERERVILV